MKNQSAEQVLNEILLRMNYDSRKTLSENSGPISEQAPKIKIPQLEPMPYTGPQYTPSKSDMAQVYELSKIEPKEFTEKLPPQQYNEFVKERNRISKLPPSFVASEYNSKWSSALNQLQIDKESDYWGAETTYNYRLSYLTALYYPKKWNPGLKEPIDVHDALLLVAIGIFSIPLLLAAAGASPAIVASAMLGANVISTSADVLDAVKYLEEGDLESAGLSAIFALIPFVPNLTKFSKSIIESAVKKYSKGGQLTKEEVEVITELSKSETKAQINAAAESQAIRNTKPGIKEAIIQGTQKVKQVVAKGAKMTNKALSTTMGKITTTLAGFYILGQSYERAVESYKKSQLSPFEIYQNLVNQKKISVSWNDLKWAFGSTGTKEDNQKLAAALLSGFTEKDSNKWLYEHPEFRTKTWTEKWLPIYQQELDKQKYTRDVITSLESNKSKENREKAINIQKEKFLTDEDGTKRTEEEFKEITDSILNDKNLFDVTKEYKK